MSSTVPAGGERVVRLRLRQATGTPAQPFGAAFDDVFRDRIAEADEFYAERVPPAATAEERRVAAAGLRRAPLEQAVLPLRDAALARGRSRASPRRPPERGDGPQRRVAARLQPRHHLDARQVGVSLVRGLGPRLPHDPVRADRPPLRQGAAPAPAARVVHAPERPDPGLRVRLRRREPAGARLGLLAGLQDDRRQGAARPAVPRARVPEAAAQLHLVGEPQGPGGAATSSPAASSGSTTSASSTARARCRPAATWSRPTAPRGWRSTATPCCRMALELASEDPAYEDLASKFFEHFVAIARRHQHARRLRPVGRGRRLLLRPAPRGRPARAAAGPLAGGRDPADRGRGAGRGDVRASRGLPEADALVPGQPPGRGAPDRLHDAAAGGTVTATGCWRSRRASAWSACSATCWTRASSSRPHGIRSVSRVHREHPYEIDVHGEIHRVDYAPAEGTSGLFGGNSNWRGPVWFPINYLLLEALERYHHFYGDDLKVECPVGSGRMLNLQEVAWELREPAGVAVPAGRAGRRPCHGERRALRRPIPTGRTWCCSTSTSTATTAAASAPATRPAGPRSCSAASRTGRATVARRRSGQGEGARPAGGEPAMSAPIAIDDRTEWLEADGLGGFASGTTLGVRTRRYHALLLAATTPPTGRMVLVNGLDAWVETRRPGRSSSPASATRPACRARARSDAGVVHRRAVADAGPIACADGTPDRARAVRAARARRSWRCAGGWWPARRGAAASPCARSSRAATRTRSTTRTRRSASTRRDVGRAA